MLSIISQENAHLHWDALASMHQLRRQVFSERLRWGVTVINGLEIDQFDIPDAHYLVHRDPEGRRELDGRRAGDERAHAFRSAQVGAADLVESPRARGDDAERGHVPLLRPHAVADKRGKAPMQALLRRRVE